MRPQICNFSGFGYNKPRGFYLQIYSAGKILSLELNCSTADSCVLKRYVAENT